MSRVDRRFLIAAVFIGALIGIDAYFNALVPEVTAPSAESIPRQLGEWQGMDVALGEEELDEILAGGRLAAVQRLYKNSAGQVVDAIAIYLERPEAVHHTPERCLTGAGWSLSRISTTSVPLIGESGTAEANLVTGLRGEMKIVELFLFASGDGFRRSALQSLVAYSQRGLSKRDQTLAMVIMTTQIAADADDREALEYMFDFAGRYLPAVRASMAE